MIDLVKILKDEAWLKGELLHKYVPLYDIDVFQRSVDIWNQLNELHSSKNIEYFNGYYLETF